MATSSPAQPSVVAVVVSRDGGDHAEVALHSLAAQAYGELAVLVLTANGDPTVAHRVGRACPSAFVRVVPDATAYGPLANLALEMVDGAAYYLLCHDDVELEPGAVRALVDASVRENAGIVTPKYVDVDQRALLLHVGQSADRTGAIAERVTPGEIDAGQHDAVREVFVAPSGVTLVRADLFAELGGFDPAIKAMAEDLEFSWRAQVAGARVVFAPQAVVSHHRVCAGGFGTPDSAADLQGLERRHELRAMLVNSSWLTLSLWLPVAAALSLVEWSVAVAGRDDARRDAVRGAWGWNLRRLGELRRRRGEVAALRSVPDRELHDRMLPGSARAKVFMSRLFYQGLTVARGGGATTVLDEARLATIGDAFSENQDFDDLDDLGHGEGPRTHRWLGTRTGRATAYGLALVLYLVAARGLLVGRLAYVGQFAPWPSWTGALHDLATVWHPTGLGSTVAPPTGFGAMALLGVLTLGHMGLAEQLLVVAALPIGAVGVGRLLTPLVSERARLGAVVAYACTPLFAATVVLGRLDAIVALATVPWLVVWLGRSAGIAHLARPMATAPFGAAGWISTRLGRFVALCTGLAIAASLAPAITVDLVVVAVAFALGGTVFGRLDVLGIVRVAVAACVAAAGLCFPWVVDMVAHPSSLLASLGTPFSPTSAPSASRIVTFAVGIHGPAWWSWALLAGAALPILVVRGERLVFATQLSATALASWALAMASAWHLLGNFAPRPEVVLVPGAMAVAALVGLAISGFEVELSDFAFSWRQVVTVVGLGAASCSMLTVVTELPSGRFDLGTTGLEASLATIQRTFDHGGGRILWLGDPRVLPVAGWSLEPGLDYATTTSTVASAWSILPAGDAPNLATPAAITAILTGATTNAGTTFARDGITTVVVVGAVDASIANDVVANPDPAPRGLIDGLRLQDDLVEQSDAGGLDVFTVADAHAIVGYASHPSVAAAPGIADGLARPTRVDGSLVVLASPSSAIRATGGPSGTTVLTPSATEVSGSWSTLRLTVATAPVVTVEVLVELALWALVAAALLGRLAPMARTLRRRRPATEATEDATVAS